MTKLIVDIVGDPKEVPAGTSKAGKPYNAFKSYSFKSGDTWYQVRGKGGDSLTVGQPVNGTIERRTYTKKDGEEGTSCTFTLVTPEVSEILARLDKLESEVFDFDDNKSDESTEKREEDVDIENIPF